MSFTLVRIRLDRGDFAGAEESGRRAVTLARAAVTGVDCRRILAQAIATATLGAAHPLVAACRDHLAGLLRQPQGPGARPLKGELGASRLR